MQKLKVRKLSDEISQKEIREMVRYARNAMEDFRRAKIGRNILFFFFTLLSSCSVKLIAQLLHS